MTKPASVSKIIMDHADRMWQAEQVVAERYASRTRLLVTQTIAILGAITVALGTIIIKPDWNTVSPTASSTLLLAGFTIYAAASFKLIQALVRLLHSSGYPFQASRALKEEFTKAAEADQLNPPYTASGELVLPDEFLVWLEDNLDAEVQIVLSQILHAAENLRNRNMKERFRVRSGESAMIWGFWLSLIFLLVLFLLFGIFLWLQSINC